MLHFKRCLSVFIEIAKNTPLDLDRFEWSILDESVKELNHLKKPLCFSLLQN